MIKITTLSKNYYTKYETISALDGVNLEIKDNQLVFITGNSGSGKTTLLNCIGGFDKFDSGEIIINGHSYNKIVDVKHFGFVFQEYHLINYLSVYENITISTNNQDDENIQKVLSLVGLKEFKDKKVIDLSGGEKQRVAIARALLNGGEALLCDEPTGSLDEKTSEQIIELLKSISKFKTVIIVSHDVKLAKKYGDRIINLEDGQVVSDIFLNQEKSNKTNLHNEHLTFNKSRMRFKSMIKIALKSMFARPIITVTSLLLCCLSIIGFSISTSVNNKNDQETIVRGMMDNNINSLVVEKSRSLEQNHGISGFNEKDVEELSNLTNEPVYPIYRFKNDKLSTFDGVFYLNGYLEISQQFLDDFQLNLLYGNLPINENQVVVSELFFAISQKFGLETNLGFSYPKTYEDIIGKIFTMDKKRFEICGIIDTKFNFERYASIFYPINGYYTIFRFSYSLHTTLFVKEGAYKHSLLGDHMNYIDDYTYPLSYYVYDENDSVQVVGDGLTTNKDDIKFYFKEGKNLNNLNDNEIVVSIYDALDTYSSIKECLELGAKAYAYDHYDEIKDKFAEHYPDSHTIEDYIDFIRYSDYSDIVYSSADKNEIFVIGLEEMLSNNPNIFNSYFEGVKTLKYRIDFNVSFCIEDIHIVGLYYKDFDGLYELRHLFCDESLLDNIKDQTSIYFFDIAYCALPFDGDFQHKLKLYSLLDKFTESTDDSYCYVDQNKYKLKGYTFYSENEVSNSYYSNLVYLNQLASVSQYISIAMLTVLCFIIVLSSITSIKISTNNIGVLRSLNYKYKDLIKPYVLAPTFIFLGLTILTNLISIAIVNLVNYYQTVTQMLLFSAYQMSYLIPLLTTVCIPLFVFIVSNLVLLVYYKKPINYLVNKIDK